MLAQSSLSPTTTITRENSVVKSLLESACRLVEFTCPVQDEMLCTLQGWTLISPCFSLPGGPGDLFSHSLLFGMSVWLGSRYSP